MSKATTNMSIVQVLIFAP